MPAVAARRQYRGTFGGTGTGTDAVTGPTDWQTSTHGEGEQPMAGLAPRPHPRHGASGEGAGRGTQLFFMPVRSARAGRRVPLKVRLDVRDRKLAAYR